MENLDDLYCGQSKNAVAYRMELLRRAKGLDKRNFSDRLGIKPSTYSNMLSGTNYPSIAVILKACEEFDVDANYILLGDPSSLKHSLASLLYSLHREAEQKNT